MAQAQLSFPLLTKPEMMECLHELGIDVIETDLTQPASGKVELIYSKLIEILLDQGPEERAQPVFYASDQLEYNELHEQSIPRVSFVHSCQRLLNTCGVHDFNMDDLTKPEKQRLRRNLSAVINFAKFRQEKEEGYMQLTQETDGLEEKLKTVQAENERLQTEVHEATRKRQQEAPEEERLNAENKKREEVVRKLWNEQTALQEECHALKSRCKEITDEHREAEFKLLEAKEAEAELSAQIVDDPKKLRAELAALGEAKKSETLALEQLKSKLFNMKNQSDAVDASVKQLEEVLLLQAEVEAQQLRLKEARDSIAQLEDRHSREKGEGIELDGELCRAKQRNERKGEQLQRQKEQHGERQVLAEKELTNLNHQWEDFCLKSKQKNEQLEDAANAVRELGDQLLRAQLVHEQETARVVQQQQQLAAQARC